MVFDEVLRFINLVKDLNNFLFMFLYLVFLSVFRDLYTYNISNISKHIRKNIMTCTGFNFR